MRLGELIGWEWPFAAAGNGVKDNIRAYSLPAGKTNKPSTRFSAGRRVVVFMRTSL